MDAQYIKRAPLAVLLLYGNPLTDLSALAGKLIQIDVPAQDIDKAETIEELADALYNLPLEMYEYLLNTVEFEPYAGTMKGAQAVLETMAGNDWEIASLLAEMLGNAGITTRYVHVEIEVPIDVVMDYLGVTDPNAAALVLVNAGINQILIYDPYGQPVAMQFEHTWLEAELYVPGEGTQWIAMDPSWKFRDFQPGVSGLASLVPFDEAGYLSETRDELAYEYYADQIREYLAANIPDISIAEVPYDGPILIQQIDEIPSSLPYTILSIEGTYTAIPTTMTHRVELTLTQGFTELFNVLLSVPDVSLDRLTISFSPDGIGGLTPELRQDGLVIASGPSVFSGSDIQLIITHFDPGDDVADRSFTYDRKAGQYIAIGLDARQVSEEMIIEMRQVINQAAIDRANGDLYALDDEIGAILYLAVMKWFYDTNKGEDIINSLTQAVGVYNSVASGITTSETTTEYYPEQQIPYQPDGLSIDVANNYHLEFAIDNDTSNDDMRNLLIGHNSSAQEHTIWEELVSVESISTIKSLQLANEAGIPIYVIDSSNEDFYLPLLTHRASIQSAIAAEVASGATVTVPRNETPLNDWEGVGYITEQGGSRGYIIHGGLSTATPQILRSYSKFGDGSTLTAVQGGAETTDPSNPETGESGNTPNGTDAGDPVNVANGNLTRDETDFTLPGIGLPLTFARHYDSQSELDVGMGIGWLDTYSHFLTFEVDGSIIWTNDQGHRYVFIPDGVGGYITPESLYGTLTEIVGGYSYREKNGIVYEFDDIGKFTEIRDRNGNSLTMAYDGSGHLITVTDTDAPTRYLTFTWTGDNITAVADFTGRVWSYAYTGDYLSQVISPSDAETPVAIIQYEYYDDAVLGGLLRQITEPNGGIITYSYYLNRRGFSVTDAEGYTHSLSYNLYRNQTTFVDERGNPTTYDFDTDGQVTKVTYPDYSTDSYVWENGMMQSWTDTFGNSETYVYDELGNLIELTDRADVVTSYEYEPTYSNLTQIERFDGRITEFDHDANGNLTEITQDPLGMAYVTTMTYDSRGLLLTRTRPKGNLTADPDDYTTTYTYNDAGQVLTRTTDLPSLVSYGYDARGNRTSVTDANGTTIYDYDLLGRLIGIIDPLTEEMIFTYDAAGNMLMLTDKLGRSTSFEYDLKQQLRQTIHPDGTIVSSSYDPSGNLSILVDELGHATQYEYDSLNRLIQVLYANGAVQRTAYDGGGRVVRTTDARGYKTEYKYDELDRLTDVIEDPDDLAYTTTTEYDAVNNVRFITDPRGNTIEYRYDLLDRVVEFEDARNNITYYTYDANGNLKTVIDALGREMEYVYDELDRMTAVIEDPYGLAYTTTTDYDAVGNVVLVTDPLGNETEYVYDELNRLPHVIEDPDVLAYTTTTDYDAAGNVLTIMDPENNTTTYTYDVRNRVISETNELGLAR